MENFKRGEVIEVRDRSTGPWYERIFVCYIEGAKMSFVTVTECDEEEFKAGRTFDITLWNYARKLTKPSEEGINGND